MILLPKEKCLYSSGRIINGEQTISVLSGTDLGFVSVSDLVRFSLFWLAPATMLWFSVASNWNSGVSRVFTPRKQLEIQGFFPQMFSLALIF